MQFKAGYIVDAIANKIDNYRNNLNPNDAGYMNQLGEINGLLRYTSCFDVEFKQISEPDFDKINPVMAVINNIICRGLPTKAPLLLEETFVKIGLLVENKEEYEFVYKNTTKEIDYSIIYELLHVIEPQLKIDKNEYGGNLGSNLEWRFISKHPFLIQIFESQREYSTINHLLGGGRSVDFSYVSPYQFWDSKNEEFKQGGRIIEVDGEHHKLPEYVYYDKYRDKLAHDKEYETIRYKEETIKENEIDINLLLEKNQYQLFKKNFERDIQTYLPEYTMIFTPLAVARVQKTLIEFLLRNPILATRNKISVAIVERDVPCGALAVQVLSEMIKNINGILEKNDQLSFPEIQLAIFNKGKWVLNKDLHLGYTVKDEIYFNQSDFDLVIDHSIFRRSNVLIEKDFQHHNKKTIKIRSSHYYDTSYGSERRVYCSRLLDYKSLVERQDDGSYKSIGHLEGYINYFIQNIFRKTGFREGQLPIISRALQRKPVIGLLPTGGGKSLTYQLPVFLQPGLAIVVDPIKSLMEDQVRVLRNNWIDCCNFINSNLKREDKKKRLLALRYGETQFLFVSPERFVMDDFRQIVNNIDSSKYHLAFSFCVIDEVHCLSEWGHDFRSTYLMIGRNAQKFLKTKGGKVPIIGLTATASFDVLADIEREMEIKHDDVANAIIMIENTIRPEMFFRVIQVYNTTRIKDLNDDFTKMCENIALYNNHETMGKSQMHHFAEFEKKDFATKATKHYTESNKIDFAYNAKFIIKEELRNKTHHTLSSIVFCPTKGGNINKAGEFTDRKGVPYVYNFLNSISKGFFYSTDLDTLNKNVQQHFRNFTTGKTNHMVCTKAFGMGIDKSDIRATYHFYYSSSLESLVQEAGRAGRDKKIAESVILVSNEKIYQLSKDCLLYESKLEPEKQKMNKISNSFHRSQIRRLVNKEFKSREEIENNINSLINGLTIFYGGAQIPLDDEIKMKYKTRLNDYITERYGDRDIHNFFFDGAFKGPDVENSQFYSLYYDREFEVSDQLKILNEIYNTEFQTDYIFRYWSKGNFKRIYISNINEEELGFINVSLPLQNPEREEFRSILEFLKEYNNQQDDVFRFISEVATTDLNDGTFAEVFNQSDPGDFDFIITAEKIYLDNYKIIFRKILEISSQMVLYNQYHNIIQNKFINAESFNDLVISRNGGYIKLIFNWFSLNEIYDYEILEEFKEAYKTNDIKLFLEIIYTSQIAHGIKESNNNFQDFLLILEENLNGLIFNQEEDVAVIRQLRYLYNRSRNSKNDTGRLIYRLFCCGLLVDYKIDYNKNSLYICRFHKAENINYYLEKIESYLRRYLSEQTAISEMKLLKEQIDKKETLLQQLLQCLYYLSNFSFKEIASKRRRATDEIESILNKSIQDEKYQDKFEQNKYIKEQIYFYFNAKYARTSFKIHGMDYSLLDDYKNKNIERVYILQKYLIGVNGRESALIMEGTEQNNYKHMIGSCKKILVSLAETELKNEWLLRIMKAYSMYAVNNLSYINEANDELEKGFMILYNQKELNFNRVKEIISVFFISLFHSIKEDNENQIKENIQLIHGKILFKIQSNFIDDLFNQHKTLLN